MDTTLRSRARRIMTSLARLYPDARCSLDFSSPFQLLVATILSAQCTDVRVNQITPALFARYPDAETTAKAEQTDLETLIKPAGFYHNKAKNIILCAQQLIEHHKGQVPRTMAKLVTLAGVGRKTANVILGMGFGKPGLAVDTHVGRLSQRMGLTANAHPEDIETDLTALLPRTQWTMFGLRMIYHGRQVCQARKPNCEGCELAKWCPQLIQKKTKEEDVTPEE